MAIIFWIVVILATNFATWTSLHSLRAITALWTFVDCFLAAIALHEAAHAVVVIRHGFRLLAVAVGPVEFDFAGRHRRVCVNHFGSCLLGATFFTTHQEPDDQLIRALRRIYAAGPLASGLAAILLIPLAFVTPGFTPPYIVFNCGVFSGMIFAISVIPISAGSRSTDGARLIGLWRRTGTAASVANTIRMSSVLLRPERPADWPIDLLTSAHDVAIRPWDDSAERRNESVSATVVLYFHLLDRGDLAGSGRLLEYVLGSNRRSRGQSDPLDTVFALYALHAALWEGNLHRAEAALYRVPRRSLARRASFWWAAEIAVMLARGEAQKARRRARRIQRRLTSLNADAGALRLEQQ